MAGEKRHIPHFCDRAGRGVPRRLSRAASHASPLIIRFEGRDHAIFHSMDWLYGLEPPTGEVIWKTRLRSGAADNVSFTPIWDEQRSQIILSHGYDRSGARALRLFKTESGFEARQVWSNNRLKVRHGNGVLLQGALYASGGDRPGFLVVLDLEDGTELWRKRLPKATFLATQGKLIILDEDGVLHLARPDQDRLQFLSSVPVLEYNAWTVPTLAGRRLYLRDRQRIVAMQLP